MKSTRNLILILCFVATVITFAALLNGVRTRYSKRLNDELVSAVVADCGKHIVVLERLRTNDVQGARLLLEMSVDQAIITLYSQEKVNRLDENHAKIFQFAKEYRKTNPFVGADHGLERDPDVEALVREILSK